MNHSFFKYFLSIVLFFLANHKINSQEIIFPQGSPEWLVQQFFKSEKFPDKDKYFAGEMKEEINFPTIGEELKGKGEIYFYVFSSSEKQRAFAVNIKTDSTSLDFYCFLSGSTDGWKIEAVRRFLFPKFIYIAADSLQNLSRLSTADSSMLRFLIMMTASDEHLKKYLKDNADKFKELLLLFGENKKESVSQLIDELVLNGIFKDKNFPGCVFIQIAEMESREVGYFYRSDEAVIPRVSHENFIYIEEVLPGWFLYRLI